MVGQYSRESLFAWLREVAPDVRVQVIRENGRRVCACLFTIHGQTIEVIAESDNPDEEIAILAVNAAREALGLDSLGPRQRTTLEQDIVLAALSGDTDHCEFLTRQYVTNQKPRKPTKAFAETNFRKRTEW